MSARAPIGVTGALGRGVSDGTRTRDHLDHNQVLYQLSYTHHGRRSVLPAPHKCTGPTHAPKPPWRAPARGWPGTRLYSGPIRMCAMRARSWLDRDNNALNGDYSEDTQCASH